MDFTKLAYFYIKILKLKNQSMQFLIKLEAYFLFILFIRFDLFVKILALFKTT